MKYPAHVQGKYLRESFPNKFSKISEKLKQFNDLRLQRIQVVV